MMRHSGAVERFIAHEFPKLRGVEPADIVCEAIRRFWAHRQRYDGSRPLRPFLLGIARKVAMEVVARRFKWLKMASLETELPPDGLESRENKKIEDRLDQVESSNAEVLGAVRDALSKLKPLQREILETYASCGSIEPDAAALGRELGMKYGGVPIPAGTIRVYKLRAKQAFVGELNKLGFDVEQIRRHR